MGLNVGLEVPIVAFGESLKVLTELKARALKADDKPVRVGGVAGLYLRPGSKTGSGRYILRFVSPETGKRRDMGLGTYPETSLADARIRGIEVRRKLADGVDPIEHNRRETKRPAETAQARTFSEVSLRVHADVAPAFRNSKHSAQWINTLRTYVWPTLGSRSVVSLSTADFASALAPIWLAKPETASRVRQRCDRVMMWCVAQGLVQTNPVSSVEALLPKQPSKAERVQHHPSVPWRDMPDTCRLLFPSLSMSVGKQALLFLILTGGRSKEVRLAKWEEIDWESAVWSVPKERMKTHKLHRVPLATQSLDLLTERAKFRGTSDWIFSRSGKTPISDMTLTKILRDNRIKSDVVDRFATAHGFRSSLRDWASEHGYSYDVAERSLAHKIKNQTEAAYHRTDLLEQRREMMQRWGDFVIPRKGRS